MSVFPNPTNGLLEITLDEAFNEDYKIEIYNYLGNKLVVISKNKDELKHELDISNLPAGIYLIKCSSLSKTCQNTIIKR